MNKHESKKLQAYAEQTAAPMDNVAASASVTSKEAPQYYLAIVHGNAPNYGISFPDFPGCVSAGETLEEVIAMGTEALDFYFEDFKDSGKTPPPPAFDIERLRHDTKIADWLTDMSHIVMIPVAVNLAKAA